jgi:hypothetical protein
MSLSEKLAANLSNRKWLVSRLRAEIVGPDPSGPESDIRVGGAQKTFTWDEFRKPRRQENGEEVVWQDPPAKRYGAGVLFPVGTLEEREQVRAGEDQQAESISTRARIRTSTKSWKNALSEKPPRRLPRWTNRKTMKSPWPMRSGLQR